MASASSWDAARRRVDRRRQSRVRGAAEVAAKSQPRGFPGSGERAVAAAVQPVFPQSLPEPVDPADRVRTDRAKCGAVGGVSARSRDRDFRDRRARRPRSRLPRQKPPDEPYQPIWPKLELADESVLPPRPQARAPAAPADPAFVALGARMMPDLVATQIRDAGGFSAARPQRRRHRRPRGSRAFAGASRGSRRGAAGTLPRRVARAHLQARPAFALFHQPGHRHARLYRDAGDRPRPGRRRRLCLAHAQQCLQVPL